MRQLAKGLTRTAFRYNTNVSSIKDDELLFRNGERFKSDYTIVATGASNLIPNINKGQSSQWKSCDTLYCETKTRNIDKPLIGLIPDTEALINNIFFHTSSEMTTKQKGQLLSVAVVRITIYPMKL